MLPKSHDHRAVLGLALILAAFSVLYFNAGYGKVDAGDPPHTTEAWEGGPLRADDCGFVLVRDSGHWIWMDQPQLFLERTLAFLGRYRPRP